jgi:hypothetical protein
MGNSKRLTKLIFQSTLVVFSSIAAGVYTQPSKTQKQPKDQPRSWQVEKVTAAPEVKSVVKGLEISAVRLVNQGTPTVQIVIDVINHRDEDVMFVDFVCGIGKSTSGGVGRDGLYDEDNPVVIIPRQSLKALDFYLNSFIEGEPIVLALAAFSDGKEEGEPRSLDNYKRGRIVDQEKRRKEKAKNGGPQALTVNNQDVGLGMFI